MWVAVAAWFICFAALSASAAIGIRYRRLALLAVCLLLTVQIMVRPLMFFAGVDSPSPQVWFDPNSWNLMTVALILTAGWVAILTTTTATLSHMSVGRRMMPHVTVMPNPRMLALVVIGLTVLNVICTAYLVAQAGGVAQFVFAVKIGKALKGLYVFRAIAPLAVAVLIYAFLLSRKSELAGQPGMLRPGLIIALIVVNFAVNYAWGNRFNIAVLTLAFGVSYHFYVAPLRPLKIIIISLLFLAALEGLKEIRNFMVSEVTGVRAGNDFDFWLRISASLHFVEFDAFLLALRDAGEAFEFRQGRDALNGLLAWVPRFIYPEKETFQVGGWFRRIYEPTKINGWPITVIGNWYINFGGVGMIFGAVLSGVVITAIDNAYRDLRVNPWSAGVGTVIPFQLLDGGANFGIIQAYVLLVVPLLLIAYVLKATAPKPRLVPVAG